MALNFCGSDLGMAPGGSPTLIKCSRVFSKSASFERVEARLSGTCLESCTLAGHSPGSRNSKVGVRQQDHPSSRQVHALLPPPSASLDFLLQLIILGEIEKNSCIALPEKGPTAAQCPQRCVPHLGGQGRGQRL